MDGVYCIFLFREDMSGVYTTLNQGATGPKQKMGAAAARRYWSDRASQIRRELQFLEQAGFALDNSIDLRTEGIGADYEDTTVAYKLYETGSVPVDEDIIADLEKLLVAYEKALDSANAPSQPDLSPEWEMH